MGEKEGRRIKERLRDLEHGREFLLRVNAGIAWAGEIIKRFRKGDSEFMLLKNPRIFHGVPKGVPDLLGFDVVTITPEMVGQKIAIFVGEEVKVTGKLSPEQKSFRKMVERLGGKFRVLE